MIDRTNAERQRRYMARLKTRATPSPTDTVSDVPVGLDHTALVQAELMLELGQELAAAKACMAELEAANATLIAEIARQTKAFAAWVAAPDPAVLVRELAAVRSRIAELEAEVAALQAERKATAFAAWVAEPDEPAGR